LTPCRCDIFTNCCIIEYAGIVLAFWDGKSRGTKFVIDNCRKRGVSYKIFLPEHLRSDFS